MSGFKILTTVTESIFLLMADINELSEIGIATWLQIPEAKYTLMTLSPAIFFVSISSVIRGYFNGRQKMSATAKSQTVEQVFKTALTIKCNIES